MQVGFIANNATSDQCKCRSVQLQISAIVNSVKIPRGVTVWVPIGVSANQCNWPPGLVVRYIRRLVLKKVSLPHIVNCTAAYRYNIVIGDVKKCCWFFTPSCYYLLKACHYQNCFALVSDLLEMSKYMGHRRFLHPPNSKYSYSSVVFFVFVLEGALSARKDHCKHHSQQIWYKSKTVLIVAGFQEIITNLGKKSITFLTLHCITWGYANF